MSKTPDYDGIKRSARLAADAEYAIGDDQTAFDRAIDAAVEYASMALTAALQSAAEAPPPSTHVRVKPLDWLDTGISWQVRAPGGTYVIPKGVRFKVFRDSYDISKKFGGYDTEGEAKAAAKADHDSRIISAIEFPPPQTKMLGRTDLDGTHMCEGCGTVLHHGGHCDCSWNRSIVPVREERL